MNEVDAVGLIIDVLSASDPFSGSSPLYGAVEFVAEYPLEDMSTPKVAVSVFGGGNAPRGLGTYKKIGRPNYQVDVLADDMLSARRIFQHVRQAIMADYENSQGVDIIGSGYLKFNSVKSVTFDEPSSQPWDTAGRVQRVTAPVTVQYLEQ